MVYTKAHQYYQNNTVIRLPDYTTPPYRVKKSKTSNERVVTIKVSDIIM